MSFHHEFSASGSKRYLACAGSIKAAKNAKKKKLIPMEQESSDPAMLGTTVHALAEECLLTGKDPKEFFQTYYTCENDDEEFTYFVDEKFVKGAEIYVNYCRQQLSEAWDAVAFVEAKSDLIKLVKADCGGSTDYAILEMNGTLHIIDYKNGYGVVEVFRCSQLMIYALGIYLKYDKKYKFTDIKMTIVQPNASHVDGVIRSTEMIAYELMGWADDVLIPGIKKCQGKDPELVAGDHCTYCDVEGICKENANHSISELQEDFSDVIAQDTKLVDPKYLTLEEQIAISASRNKIETWLKSVDENLENAAFAGHHIPNKKIVKAVGNRKWINENKMIKALKKKKIEPAVIMDLPKLKSPAQLETVLKMVKSWDKKQVISFINKHTERPDRGYHLVDETDKRQAVENPGAEDFEDVPALEAPKKVSKKLLKNKKLKNQLNRKM